MQAVHSSALGRQALGLVAPSSRQCSPAVQPLRASRPRICRAHKRVAARAAAGNAQPAPAAPAAAAAAAGDTASLTEQMFRQMEQNNAAGPQALGAGGTTSYEAFKRTDAAWKALRTRKVWGPRPEFVRTTRDRLAGPADVDVVVCGGTLGIFLACSLQLRGLRVAVIERGPLQGRAQEWNISRKELQELVELGVLSDEEVEGSISIDFNPVRVGFHTDKGTSELWTRDVLNLGVSPAKLIAAARQRFEAAGGQVLERTPLNGVWVGPDGVTLMLGSGTAAPTSSSGNGNGSNGSNGNGNGGTPQQQQLTARLVLDAMGHASPVVQQMRWGQKPDGICLVVGCCARGFDPATNTTGDVIFTNSHSQPPAAEGAAAAGAAKQAADAAAGGAVGPGEVHNTQYFWEAFPAGSDPRDRTTYMFTYMDAQPNRPSLEAMLEDYWQLMPQYQGVDLQQLQVQRILFGWFPTFRNSPLPPAWDRVLQVGDASGIQSPLSFGGFGALTRHLGRMSDAIVEALEADMLSSYSLSLINAYNPGLSGAWMLQRAMSIPADRRSYDQAFVNKLLAANFKAMNDLGDATLKPFLQDVIQLKPLVQTLGKQMLSDPLMVPQILGRVGLFAMMDWLLHLLGLILYTFLNWDMKKYVPLINKLPPKPRFIMRRTLDNFKFGAGKDYTL